MSETNLSALLLYTPLSNVKFDEQGLTITDKLSYDQYEGIVKSLAQIHQRSKMFFIWSWGDLLNYGEKTYGQKYTQAMSLTGLAYQTLVNYKWLARATPRDLRGWPNLSQAHYERVVKIKDHSIKYDLLEMASQEKWPAKTTLTNAVTALIGPDTNQDTPPPGSSSDKLNLIQQENYILEQRNIELQLKQDLLQNQMNQAEEILSPIVDQLANTVKVNVEQAIETLHSEINGEMIGLVKQIVILYRQGNMVALVDILEKLSILMENNNV